MLSASGELVVLGAHRDDEPMGVAPSDVESRA